MAIAVFFLSLLIILAVILVSPSPLLIRWLSSYICSEAVYFFESPEPVIALTIDDSPDDRSEINGENTTKNILKILEKYQVNATFFIISSQAENKPEIVKEIVKQGHEIGNHLTKDEPSIKLGDKFETELLKAEKILSEFAPLTWFRPGSGWCNSEMATIAKQHNYKIALGSVWSYDTSIPSSQFASWFIFRNARPGAIIVLHDRGKNSARGKRTVETLDRVIPQLQKQGYRLVTLSELERITNNSKN